LDCAIPYNSNFIDPENERRAENPVLIDAKTTSAAQKWAHYTIGSKEQPETHSLQSCISTTFQELKTLSLSIDTPNLLVTSPRLQLVRTETDMI
jgi:hypothetical protein